MERRLHEWALPTLRHYGAPEAESAVRTAAADFGNTSRIYKFRRVRGRGGSQGRCCPPEDARRGRPDVTSWSLEKICG
jgi:hypothetical protein